MGIREISAHDRIKKAFAFSGSLLLLLLVIYVDYLSGSEVHLTVLLLIPIYFATWYSGLTGGSLLSVLGASSLILDPILERKIYPHLWEVFWNIAVVLIFFLVFTYLLARLQSELKKAVKTAHTDNLTGLLNTRAFYEVAEEIRIRSIRQGHPFIICYLDLDNFKQINDTLGHMMGDELLMVTASVMKECVRKTDIVARLGGDEFTILLPATDPRDVKGLIHRLHEEINEANRQRGWGVTLSIGAATFYQVPGTLKEILHQSDRLMYKAKKAGKNQIYSKVFGNPAQKQKIPS